MGRKARRRLVSRLNVRLRAMQPALLGRGPGRLPAQPELGGCLNRSHNFYSCNTLILVPERSDALRVVTSCGQNGLLLDMGNMGSDMS